MAHEELARERGLRGVLFSYPGCPPIIGVPDAKKPAHDCAGVNLAVLGYIAEHAIPVVFVQSIWMACTKEYSAEV